MNILRRKVREARSAAYRKDGTLKGSKGVSWKEQVPRETSETDDQYYERVEKRGKSDFKR